MTSPAEALASAAQAVDWPAAGPIWVACSGGADSMALVALARRQPWGSRLRVVHVDHGLCAASAGWARQVAAFWRAEGVEVRVVAVRVGPGNTEAQARRARYAVFDHVARASLGVVLTAHTAEDQAETVLMRLGSGSGLRGLRGILPARGAIRRPWLSVSRSDVRAVATSLGLPIAQDPANANPAFDRVRVRQALVAVTAALGDGWCTQVAASAAALQDAHDQLRPQRALARARLTAHPGWYALNVLGWTQWPAARQRGVLIEAIRALGLGGRGVREHVASLNALAGGGSGGAVALPGGWVGRRRGADLIFTRAREEMCSAVRVPAPGRYAWGAGILEVAEVEGVGRVWLPMDGAGLELRGPQPGDRFQRQGAPGRRALGRALRDWGVPASPRARWPVLAMGPTVVWVAGLGRDARVPPAESGDRGVWITWTWDATGPLPIDPP